MHNRDVSSNISMDSAVTLETNIMPLNQRIIKASFICSEQEKQSFVFSKAVLPISVGQAPHEGEKFAATVALVNKHFASCDVVVGDSLQRHTMQITEDASLESLYLNANRNGEAWIKRNEEALRLLTIPHRLFRWDEYLMHPDFEACYKKIIRAYQECELFANEMDETIRDFIERMQRRSSEIDPKKAFDCCFKYLSEECAIMTLMWPECQYNYMIYPNSMPPKIFTASRHKFVLPSHPGLLKWLRVRLRIKSDIHMQSTGKEFLEINQ